MKILFFIIAVAFHLTTSAQTPLQISRIFSSEPQNKMASNIPELLIEAFRNGDVQAYYPARPNVPLSYTQFLYHFGATQKAQSILTSSPEWFCEGSASPLLDKERIACLSRKFELGEKLVENRVTMMNELKMEFIRLVHESDCDPRGIDSYGPVFRISDIGRLQQKKYQIQNPDNAAVSYSIIDLLRLRLFAARK